MPRKGTAAVLVAAAAAVAVAASASAAPAAAKEYVTPEFVAPAGQAPRFVELREEPASKDAVIDEAVRRRREGSVATEGLESNEPTIRSPYTYDNSQPAYRSTYYRYPWMHEAFGPKPMELARVPIGAHVEFPWQREAREEYAQEKEGQRQRLGDGHQRLPHPLAMTPDEHVPRWATSFPFAHPSATYPFYPTAHAAGVHAFGYYGAGADPLTVAHMHAHSMVDPSMPHFGPYGSAFGGVMDPYYSVTPAVLAATQQGATALPYGAGWYGAGATDLI